MYIDDLLYICTVFRPRKYKSVTTTPCQRRPTTRRMIDDDGFWGDASSDHRDGGYMFQIDFASSIRREEWVYCALNQGVCVSASQSVYFSAKHRDISASCQTEVQTSEILCQTSYGRGVRAPRRHGYDIDAATDADNKNDDDDDDDVRHRRKTLRRLNQITSHSACAIR